MSPISSARQKRIFDPEGVDELFIRTCRIDRAWRDLDVMPHPNKHCAHFRVDKQQRVAIARAVENSPKLILADEPTGNLDSRTSDEIMRLLTDLNGAGKTIIMVTHDAHAAEAARRMVHLEKGELVG